MKNLDEALIDSRYSVLIDLGRTIRDIENIGIDIENIIHKMMFMDISPFRAKKAVINFILGYENIWHDIRNVDPYTQSQRCRELGLKPLYLDKEHKQINVDTKDYLRAFMEYERVWASRKHTGSAEGDWSEMQHELAFLISISQEMPLL